MSAAGEAAEAPSEERVEAEDDKAADAWAVEFFGGTPEDAADEIAAQGETPRRVRAAMRWLRTTASIASSRVGEVSRAGAVLELLRKEGPLARDDIAEKLGATLQEASNTLSGLQRRGKIQKAGAAPRSAAKGPAEVFTWELAPVKARARAS